MGRSVTPMLLYGFNLGEGYWWEEEGQKPEWFNDEEYDFGEAFETAIEELVVGFTEEWPNPYTEEAMKAYRERRLAAEAKAGVELAYVGYSEAESLFALVAKRMTDYTEDVEEQLTNFDKVKADANLWRAVEILQIPVDDQVPHWWLDFNYG